VSEIEESGQLEGGVNVPDAIPPALAPPLAESTLTEFRCTGCGYGASCRMAPEMCPMCGASTWEHVRPKGEVDSRESR
jgi:rubrerythrin